MIAFRQLTEPGVAKLAAANRTEADARAIGEALAGMERGRDDHVAFYLADRRFHEAIFTAARNRFVRGLGNIVMVVLEFSFAQQERSLIAPERSVALHRDVADAILAGDPQRAEEAMRVIIDVAAIELRGLPASSN